MLITISIDLSGSTLAKSEMLRLCGRGDRLQGFVRRLIRGFTVQEIYFHSLLIHEGFDPNEIFVVKPIGDEVWIVIDIGNDIEREELTSHIARVLRAALPLTRRTVDAFASELDPANEEAAPPTAWGKTFRTTLPIKVFLDLVHDDGAIETSQLRYRTFTQQAHSFVEPGGMITQAHMNTVIERFAGAVARNPREAVLRSDYCGPDIDRFFRCTKWATPFMVTCGETLVEAIQYDEVDQRSSAEQPPKTDGIPTVVGVPLHKGPNARSYDRYHFVRKTISASDSSFKGVLEDYAVFYVLHHSHGLWPFS